MTTRFVQITTTTEKREDAERIARLLVEGRLAACVQIVGPIKSVYRWKGAVETAEEYLCLAKTRSDLYEAVEAAILDAHPYEVPEIVAVPIIAGSASYLAWLKAETASGESPPEGSENEP